MDNGDKDYHDLSSSSTNGQLPPTPTSGHPDDDGVMLDRDQPLHSTPVLVSLPSPGMFSPSSDSLLMPPPASGASTMTSMFLPPANGTLSASSSNNVGGSTSTSASFGGRSLLRPVDEVSSFSTKPNNTNTRNGSSSVLGGSDSFLSVDSSDEDSESSARLASGEIMKRHSERYAEEASFEARVIRTANVSIRSSSASQSSFLSEGVRPTALSIAPSGPMGRQRTDNSESHVIVLGSRPTSPDHDDDGHRASVNSTASSYHHVSDSVTSSPHEVVSSPASSFSNTPTPSSQKSGSFDHISLDEAHAANDHASTNKTADQQSTLSGSDQSPPSEFKANSPQENKQSRLRSVSNGDAAVPTPNPRRSSSALQPNHSPLLTTHSESPTSDGARPKFVRNRANSTGSLAMGRRRDHEQTPPFSILEQPQEIWELLTILNVAKSNENTSTTTTTSCVEILQWIFANWSSPELSHSHVQEMWNQEMASKNATNGHERINGNSGLPEQPILHASGHARPLSILCTNTLGDKVDLSLSTSKSMSSLPLTTVEQQSRHPLFWQLPTSLLKVFLRILTLLITQESNDDYQQHVSGVDRRRKLPRQQSTSFLAPEQLQQQQQQRQEPPRPDIVYNVARLSSIQKTPKDEKEHTPRPDLLLCILTLIECAMSSLEQPLVSTKQQQQYTLLFEQQRHYSEVLPALIYLLGVWGVAGITPLVLRRWLALIVAQSSPGLTNNGNTTTVPVVFRDALVRALSFATQHGSLVVPPRSFFTFQRRPGRGAALKRAIKGLPHWPFRNDFGTATWFRAEHAHQKVHLVSVRTDQGAGWTISLHPLAGSGAYSLVVSVYDNGKTDPAHQITVSGCVLVPRNWYHVAVRHTRSRLKGVFSLSTRQQLVLMLDGKIMVNQALPFPRIEQSETGPLLLARATSSSQTHSRLNLEIDAAVGLEGQMGSLYIFKENVADASFRALYEATGGKDHRTVKRSDANASLFTAGTWDARHREILRKSRILDVTVKNEDADDIVVMGVGAKHSKRFSAGYNGSSSRSAAVIDFDDPDHELTEVSAHIQQDLTAFGSKVFIVWDPSRCMDSLAFELHVGAHVVLDEHVSTWHNSNPQDVISSIGGIQALIPLFRSMIAVGAADDQISILPNLFSLLAVFVQEHPENARELLRCGGIDVIEQLLFASKRIGTHTKGSSVSAASSARSSLFSVLCSNEQMSSELVESLLVFRAASQHFVGLEAKVFSRLLFNIPLWFGQSMGTTTGGALHLAMLPALSFLTKSNPEKVRECVGAKEMIDLLRELAMIQDEQDVDQPENRFLQSSQDNDDGYVPLYSAPLSHRERRHLRRVILGMVFCVLSVGTSSRDLGPLLRFISMNVETSGSAGMDEGGVPLRHQVQLELCTVLLFLMQLNPPIPGSMESFTQCCGNVQSGIGWILSVMAKATDEKMIALGIRCLFAYLRTVSKSDDQPVALNSNSAVAPQQEDQSTVATTTEAASATVALASSTVASLAKGIASSMGPAGRAMVFSPSKLTPRVVYKLLWHLLKSHRLLLGIEVRNALLYCMSDAQETLGDTMLSSSYLLEKVVIHAENGEKSGWWFSYDIALSMLQKSGNIVGRSLQNKLVIATVLRLLRFLPPETAQQWLMDLLLLVKSSRKSIGLISSLDDWQSSLFHLVSDTVEELSSRKPRETTTNTSETDGDVGERLDLCLELYSTLLGHLLREGGEKALDAVEHAASLQRVCVNGQVVLLLILSALCSDLFDHGTLLEVGSLTAEDWKDIDLEQDSLLLKQSAKLVTDAILSNGTEGLDINAAVRSWRSLRHLAEVVVALVSKSGLGVVDLFAYNKHRASAIDSITGGLHGIRLSETRLQGASSNQYWEMLGRSGVSMSAAVLTSEDARREIDRRLCVTLAAQILTLLDAFIFPESLDTSLPASQTHGLALVRNSEPRLGAAQGPLIASAIKLSFLLMSSLEPCSVRMLQCVSRLRCLVQWALDLIRESSNREGAPPSAFQEKIASMDRLLLAVVLHCHRALGRCSALLAELEVSSSEKFFGGKDAQKKHYRRLVRVALELRNVVSTTYRGRNNVIKSALSTEAVEELRASLEGSSGANSRSGSKEASAKEFLVAAKEFLGSRWVTRFQDVEIRGDLSVPEQVTMDTISLGNEDTEGTQGFVAVEQLAKESSVVQADFEKAIDSSFDGYLEAQRKWAETENVRDLEYEGDTITKKLSEKYEADIVDLLKDATSRRVGADNRWNGIHRKAVSPWLGETHFKLREFPDRCGRRTLLAQNRAFTPHKEAAYDSGTGPNSVDPSPAPKGESDLTDLIRRNAEAFTLERTIGDDDSVLQSSDDEATDQESANDTDSLGSNESELLDPGEVEHEDEWDKIDSEEIEHVDRNGDVDGWARAFMWSEHETIVARFEPVMIVSLRSYVEGKILLTTHGLYFKSSGSEINVMTKEPIEGTEIGSPDAKDRRWRLSRLTEVHGRRYLLRQQAIELFFSDGSELLLNFQRGGKERDRFHAKLRNSCKAPMLWSPKSLNPRVIFRKSGISELWRKRKISNFEYIMHLNRMAGRSFNDITQYPVFPWVLTDYKSDSIDLTDSRVFRDLSKPIGALNPDRLAQLLERYKDLELFGFPEAERFLYGSHYSSPGIVIHFLLRQEPFTTMGIELQSGRFDCADRLFFDIAASWEGCMTSSSDMKELVPEFFCLPEMFLNTNKFPLGRTQSGRVVDNVALPPWAKGSAFEFVRIQRQALESDYVSQNLHHWIDLIFGLKQRGDEAQAAHNVFHHLSYEGSVDLDKIADEVDRAAAESHIQNFGQTPSQLLQTSPHLERYSQEECWKPFIQTIRCSKQLRYHTPSRQFGNASSEFAKGPVVKVFALSDSVIAVYGDMSVGTYRWFPQYKSNRLRMDKLRPLDRRELSAARDAMKRGSLVPPDELATSDHYITSSSIALTIGGRASEELRRNAVLPSSRLMSGTEITVASAEASSMLIGCGFWDDTVKVHSSESLRVLTSDSGGHRGPIHCLSVSHDGFMVTGGKDCTCRVWVVDHADMAVAMSDGYVQTALGLSQDGESLLNCCHVLWGHETPISCLDLVSDLDVVASGSQNGLVCIHTLRRGEFIRSFRPPSLRPTGNAFTSNVSKLVVSSKGNIVVHMSDFGLFTYTVNAVLLASTNAGENLNDMEICSDGEFLVTGGSLGKVVIRQVSDLTISNELDLSKHGPIRAVTITPDELNPVNQFLFIGSDDGSITVIEKDPNAKKDDTNE